VKTITPRKVLSMYSTQGAVRKTYAAISACLELGYKNPTLTELGMIAGISRAAVQYSVERLKTAGLIAAEYTKGMVGRPITYTLKPLGNDYEGCE
jgi:response regulator of citrate/malate metabolism